MVTLLILFSKGEKTSIGKFRVDELTADKSGVSVTALHLI
jgi:hypothetical protein